jgi:hypothetical protein
MARKSNLESEVRNGTTITLFEDNSTTDEKKTFIIFGIGRGGTTMVAGVAKLCGLDIGQDLPVNMEDNDFNLQVLAKKGIEKPIPYIIDALEQRNKTMDIWGWKFPRAIAYLDSIRQHIINPHLILVSRDPIATAAREILSGTPKIKAIEIVLRLQLRNMELVKNWQAPSLIVSYERSIAYPEQFITDLCLFTGLKKPVDTAEIRTFMKPGEYKSI